MSKHVLFTFLGRTPPQYSKTGYRECTYRFPDGSEQTATYFGICLAKYLHVDEIVIFGTSGSQWGVLVESFVLDENLQEARIELLEAEEDSRVTQSMLDQITPSIKTNLGTNLTTRIIPDGESDAEQYEILSQISKAKPAGRARISIDVTHGYRHLGMIGFLSVFLLERIGNLEVEGLWYGALDMRKDGVAPVVKLDGLMRVQNWIDALERFDSTGNYGAVAKLLREDGVDDASIKQLEYAAFNEYTYNIPSAKKRLSQFLPTIENNRLEGAAGLFQDTLKTRLAWVKEPSVASYQRDLAKRFLEQGDYLRATILGWESYITKRCEAEGCEVVGDDRKEIYESLESHIKDSYSSKDPIRKAYFHLRTLRNTLAHGSPPPAGDERVRKILKNKNDLEKALDDWISDLWSE